MATKRHKIRKKVVGKFENRRKEWDFLLGKLSVLLSELRVEPLFNTESGEFYAEFAEKNDRRPPTFQTEPKKIGK